MLKYVHLKLLTILIALAPGTFLAQLKASASSLTVASSPETDAICFFQRSNGTIVDLSRLCEITPTLRVSLDQDLDSDSEFDYERYKANMDDYRERRQQPYSAESTVSVPREVGIRQQKK